MLSKSEALVAAQRAREWPAGHGDVWIRSRPGSGMQQIHRYFIDGFLSRPCEISIQEAADFG